MSFYKNNKTIFISLIFIFITLIVFRILSTPDRMLTWDVFGYYLYLPSEFIHNDIKLLNQTWINEIINKYEPTATLYQAVKLENGNWVMKYSMGLAILYFPFFIIAHTLAEPLGYSADGFSAIYQYVITIGGILFSFLGFYFFSKILKNYFNEITTSILLLIIFFGTNYFQLIAFDGTLLSHNYLFTIYAILIYYTIKWHNNQKLLYSVIIGVACGFIVLIRPSEIVCILIPLFWNVFDRQSVILKIIQIKKNILQIVLLCLSFLIILLPQILYWKNITGEYLFYSYTNSGEGIDLFSPHTYNFLFSFRKGWFVYTPIMLFSFLGFYFLFKKNRAIFYSILLFVIFDIYLISSWTCWWYAGASYSSRSIIPAYILLAIPLGYFIERIKLLSTIKKALFILLFTFLIFLNLFQTWQFEKGIITKETMTKAYYFAVFGKTEVNYNDKKLLLINRFTDANEIFNDEINYTKKILYENNFDGLNDTSENFKNCFLMNNNFPFSPGISNIRYKDITPKDHAWIKFSAKIFIPQDFIEESPLLVLHFMHNGIAYKYLTKGIDNKKIIKNSWNEIQIDYLTPEVRSEDDTIKAYIWYRSNENVYIDDMSINAYEPKL